MKFRYFFLYALICLFVWELTGLVDFATSLKKYKTPTANLNDIDILVVLTGSSGRIETAYKLFSENNIKKILISGVGKNITFDILSKEFNLDSVYKDNIILDYESSTTLENALVTASKIVEYDVKNVCIVTSLSHMKRAFFLFEKVLDGMDLNLTYYSSNINEIDFDNWWMNYKSFKIVFLEYIKYEYYRFLNKFKY